MDAGLKEKMNGYLEQRLDHLHSMITLPPELFLSQKFDSIISSIDMDAELIMAGLAKDSNEEEKDTDQTATKINEARCEIVRILKLVETNLQTQLLTHNKSQELGEAFEALEKRRILSSILGFVIS